MDVSDRKGGALCDMWVFPETKQLLSCSAVGQLNLHQIVFLSVGCVPVSSVSKSDSAKRESWRLHCEEIERAPECARLHRILSKGGQSAVSSIQLESGVYTTSEKETLEELLWVHFPGSESILEPSGGWDGHELEFLNWRGIWEDWVVSKRVISYDKFKWAVFSFQPYKFPGIDGIMPSMLHKGFELLGVNY
jgi:hypothetical protein